MNTLIAKSIKFADFELDGPKRLLRKHGQAVSLNSKTFDLLIALLERHGEVVTKDELLEKVWPGQFVEEGNLTVQISALRKIFGERKDDHRFIVTVPGRGYSFVAELDGATNGEMIIESHKFTHVVVDRTDVTDELIEAGRVHARRWMRWAPAFVAALLVAIGGIWFYIPRRIVNSNQNSSGASAFSHRVFTTAGGGVPLRVAISGDGKTLAYVEGREGKASLWLGEIESNNSVQIVPPIERMYNYVSFAPDGKTIFFTARDANHSNWAVMRVSIFGGAVQDLGLNIANFFTFSPDGSSLAFLRDATEEAPTAVVLADASTGHETRTLPASDDVWRMTGYPIAWSPDGRTIAFACLNKHENGTSVCTVDIDLQRIARIAGPVPNRIVNLALTHDGRWLIVNRNTSNAAADGQIWFVSLPGGEMHLLTNDTSNYSLFSLGVSSDDRVVVLNARSDPQIWLAAGGELRNAKQILSGSRLRFEGMDGLAIASDNKILFTAKVNGHGTIWEMDTGGSAQRQVVASQDESQDGQINVTSDNRFLVFESTRSGEGEIWRANRDGSDLRQLTSGGGNSQPTVSPDGASVVYVSRRDGKATIWRVSIDGGEPSQLITEQTSWPVVSPDGRFIACAYGRLDAGSKADGGIAIYPFAGGNRISSFQLPVGAIIYNRLRWAPDGKAILYKDVMQGLWRQNISGEKAEHLAGLEDFRVVHLATSATDLIYSGGPKMREIILLENFR